MLWHARTSQARPTAPQAMPTPAQLAALGPVLCLARVQPGGALAGWAQAARSEVACDVEREGPCEAIHFVDARERPCWRLYLLPDSDFLAWDALIAGLRTRAGRAWHAARGHRLERRLHAERWSATVLCLRTTWSHADAGTALAADRTSVSPLGLSIALRIARTEGIELDAPHNTDCCCQHHAWR